ncbi:MAG TPA: amidase family protein, partial [Nitrososphaeraceae archaeon]|nr:amidase family protein [Nitrososphaeraceae archaeon]
APFLDEKEVNIEGRTTEVYFSLSGLTTVFNINYLPSLNIPAGLVDSKLPVGVQLVGRPFDEARILQIAYSYEQHYSLCEQFIPPAIA